jgi:cell division protein FtsZ
MFELMDGYSQNAVIKVIGVGGGGGNAVQHMVPTGSRGWSSSVPIPMRRPSTTLMRRPAADRRNITKGLGAGANPEIGRQAAMEDRDRLIEVIEGTDMLFITAGMGGGTGTGAAPVVAQIARELGVLTVAVVTKPFVFEGGSACRRLRRGSKNSPATWTP